MQAFQGASAPATRHACVACMRACVLARLLAARSASRTTRLFRASFPKCFRISREQDRGSQRPANCKQTPLAQNRPPALLQSHSARSAEALRLRKPSSTTNVAMLQCRASCRHNATAAAPICLRARCSRPRVRRAGVLVAASNAAGVAPRQQHDAGQQQQQHAHAAAADAPQQDQPPSFDWRAQWYPVAFVADMDPGKLHRFTLLGTPLVIWHQQGSSSDASRGWRVFADRCPHRLVPLSEGRVTDGQLECPYHGWRFDGGGSCVSIPQGGNLSTPRACATAYRCAVAQGLLFVLPTALPKAPVPKQQAGGSAGTNGSSSSSSVHGELADGPGALHPPLPLVAEFEQQAGWLVQDTWRDTPFDATTLLENVLDASHVPFTHHRSISSRDTVGDYDMALTQPVTRAGFQGLWATGPRAGGLGAQATQFRPPCYMQHKIDASATRGWESMVVVYAVPVAPGQCRLLNRNAFRFTGKGLAAKLPAALMARVPRWAIHLGTQVPLEDDQIFLHFGEAEYVAARQQHKSAAQALYMPSRADTYITAFRRWLAQHGGGGPFGPEDAPGYAARLGPRLTHEQLLDRYSQHTANCSSCQAALRRVQLARRLSGAAAVAAGALATLTAAVAAAGLGAGAGAGGLLGQLLPLLVRAAAWLAGVPAAALPGGGGDAAAAAGGRLLLWLAVAGVAAAASSQLAALERRFHTGDYPPPRNWD